jgi:hypothetical protein
MSIGNLIFNLPTPTKNLVRLIEKTNKKLINKTNSLVFNKTCLKEEILPAYTNIRTHDPAARGEMITV